VKHSVSPYQGVNATGVKRLKLLIEMPYVDPINMKMMTSIKP